MKSFFKLISKGWLAILAILLSCLGLFLGSGAVLAYYATGTYGSGTYGSCKYGVQCDITLSSNGSLNLDITPTTSGKCTIHSDSPSVLTDDTDGYTLTVADNSTNTSLVNGASSISTTSGTVSSPTTLSGNSWGFRVDGLGGFGAGPTTTQDNVARGSITFSSVKASNVTADTIASTSGAADPAVATTVWYGACADTSVASGTYSTQVLYTAIAN